MMVKIPATSHFLLHGSLDLPSVTIDSYNIGLKDKDGFVGDRANLGAFMDKLEGLRKLVREDDTDPLGKPAAEMKKKQIDAILVSGDPKAAALVHGAIEEFAGELAGVIRRFLRTDDWAGTERIVVGGGLRQSRAGELAIARTSTLLKAEGISIEVVPIRNHPDEAGLLGAAHLLPAWTLKGRDGILAVDIGGSNIRVGIVELNLGKRSDLSKAGVRDLELWRHVDDSPSRTSAIDQLVTMLQGLIETAAKAGLLLAPVIGVGCPGKIEGNGFIARGGQNLPGGNWEKSTFNLPQILTKAIPTIDDEATFVVMHNDAVVQGLSEVPFMQDLKRWGVLTIGTGLGNARFTNKTVKTDDGKAKQSKSQAGPSK